MHDLEASHAGCTHVGTETHKGETEETKCCQEAEKGFPVLELISPNRGADNMLSHQQGGRGKAV